MCALLHHRGPDGDGFWSDAEVGVSFGHRRLAIIDLSKHGRQPMLSADGRFCITYNGELYNTSELTAPLTAKGISFRGTSDTEVLVNSIAVFGLDATVKRANGIFAFAVWDRRERTLSLVRDRVGVKPLFYAEVADGIAFASEVRALALLDDIDTTLDPAAIGCFLQYNAIRAPLSIYRGVRALEAGAVLTVPVAARPACQRYWSLAEVVAEGREERQRSPSLPAAIDELDSLLSDAVARQLVSDVPIGCFLSGGIDSSTVSALMQKARTQPIRTFSIGFEDPALDEARAAREVARHLGTDHEELYVSEREVLDTFPLMAAVYDQPFADLSTVPTYLLCRMARRHATVALSGDGGDEMFYGYSRFTNAHRVRTHLKRIPTPLRRAAAAAINRLGGHHIRADGFKYPGHMARMAWHASRLVEFASRDADDAYLHFAVHWSNPERIAPGTRADFSFWSQKKSEAQSFDERMMLYDAETFMTEQVLAKVDRASMAVSLEARVPLLDHRVIEHAWRMPQALKFNEGVGKWCMRQVLYRYVPRELIDRPKSGFKAPIGAWLRGPLRDWGEELLSERSLSEGGVLSSTVVRSYWAAHLSGRVDLSALLWSPLMLQAWLRNVRNDAALFHQPAVSAPQ